MDAASSAYGETMQARIQALSRRAQQSTGAEQERTDMLGFLPGRCHSSEQRAGRGTLPVNTAPPHVQFLGHPTARCHSAGTPWRAC